MLEKFIKYTQKLEQKTLHFLLKFHNIKEKVSTYQLKIYLALFILLFLFLQSYYIYLLLHPSQHPLYKIILALVLTLPTLWLILLLIRVFIYTINPKYIKSDKRTLAIKKELLKKQTKSNTKSTPPKIKTKLTLAKEYTHTYITSELKKLHNDKQEHIKAFVYHHFTTNDYRQKFRTNIKKEPLPRITTTKETYIEFYWVLHKSNILKNSFADIARFLANTFGKDKNSPLYKIESSTITKYPSEKNYQKKYKTTPNLRSFFNKIPK